MSESSRSRRTFIGGAAAAATVVTSLAVLGRGGFDVEDAGNGRVRALPGESLAGAGITPGTSAPWIAAVGQTIRMAGEFGNADGRIVAVERGPIGSARPAGLRAESLLVYFEFDVRTAPVGNRIYDMGQTIDALDRLFLTRGEDRAGKAILMAVLN